MLSQVFQPVLDQMKSTFGKEIGVLNNSSTLISYVGKPINEDLAYEAIMQNAPNQTPFALSEFTFVAFGMRNMLDYLVYVHGDSEEDQKLCQLLAVTLSNLQLHCGDKYDKTNYLKNVLMGNVLPGDIYLRSGELQIDVETPRVVYIIQLPEPSDISIQHLLQNMFPEHDFVLGIDTLNVVLIKSLPPEHNRETLTKIAKSIVETVNSELMMPIYIGVGTPVETIHDISRSYSEAQLALEIGEVFDGENYILSYDTLGIGRLIYQLPTKLCELFLDEIFKKESIDVLDEETIQTIYKFFENNLNVSETSRQLFVHRNTLVYRLDKIERLTGLDLRNFDDAVIFKVAILVNKYLRANSAKF